MKIEIDRFVADSVNCDDPRDAVCALNYVIVKTKLDDNAVYTLTGPT